MPVVHYHTLIKLIYNVFFSFHIKVIVKRKGVAFTLLSSLRNRYIIYYAHTLNLLHLI